VDIYTDIMDELNSRNTYKSDVYAPFYICSYMSHMFNIFNQHHQIYWESKRLPNLRLHLLFVAPRGYMKTYYLSTMGGNDHSIFPTDTPFPMGYEQSMTESGLIGTINSHDGEAVTTAGAASEYRNGFMLIDEFSSITESMSQAYNKTLESHMLTLLDSGHVNKRLGPGVLRYDSQMTLWAGVQPAKYDLSSGLGRRICYLVFMPTRHDNDNLMEVMNSTRNIKPSADESYKRHEKVKNLQAGFHCIKDIEFGDSVYKTYKDLKLFSFETSLFDRLLIGWHIARQGVEGHMTIDVDKDAYKLLKQQKEWRDNIARGADHSQMSHIIKTCSNEKEITEGMIKANKSCIINECLMIGWSSIQVSSVLNDMATVGLLRIKGGEVWLNV